MLPASAYLVIPLDENSYLAALVILAAAWRGNTVLGSEYRHPGERITTLAAYLSTRHLCPTPHSPS